MKRYKVSAEKLGRGIVDCFCDDDAPDIVIELNNSLGSLLNDYDDVDRLDLIVTVFDPADQ